MNPGLRARFKTVLGRRRLRHKAEHGVTEYWVFSSTPVLQYSTKKQMLNHSQTSRQNARESLQRAGNPAVAGPFAFRRVFDVASHLNEQAFSLIELLVALTVLSIGLFTLAGMQQTAIHGITASRDLTSAVFLAETKINELQAQGYEALASGTSSDPNNPVDAKGESGGMFTRSWTIRGHGPSMKQITVTVSWRDLMRGSRSTSLDTIVSKTMD